MKKTEEKPANGVVITQETAEQSKEKKRQRRTLRQLPLYRDMANLKYMIARIYEHVPRKMTKYIDSMLNTATEAKKCVGLGEAARDAAARAEYLSMARIFIEDVQDDATILTRLNIIDKQTEKIIKRMAKGIVAQCVAWRDYTNGQGGNN